MPDRGFVMSFTDVTAERQAAQAIIESKEQLEQRVTDRTEELARALKDAERANSTKSRFVAAASHDLLQPLLAAKLYVTTLVSNAESETARSVATKASSALGSVEHILDALLDISKLESGQASVHVSAVPPKTWALAMMLETWGVQVPDCKHVDEASTLLREIGVGPDVIIADYQLDKARLGTDAASHISAEFGPLPVCIISADRSIELVETCGSRGFALIHKPIDTNKLLTFLLNCASGQESPAVPMP